VPFVPLGEESLSDAILERNHTARWIGEELGIPVFLYGPLAPGTTRDLPTVRREAFHSLAPEWGPRDLDPRSGAAVVGAREILVAWNLWLRGVSLEETRALARELRRPGLRALGLSTGEFTQVSCNLIDWTTVGPREVYEAVRQRVGADHLERAELVGLAPRALLDTLAPEEWPELGFAESTTIESRLA
jgi:glutamate formiminotransferase